MSVWIKWIFFSFFSFWFWSLWIYTSFGLVDKNLYGTHCKTHTVMRIRKKQNFGSIIS